MTLTRVTPHLSAHAKVTQQTHIQVKCLHECHMSCMKCHHAQIPSHSLTPDEYLKYSFYPYALVSFSSAFMLNKCPNALKVHTYDQVIHLMELCKIGGKTTTEAATVF